MAQSCGKKTNIIPELDIDTIQVSPTSRIIKKSQEFALAVLLGYQSADRMSNTRSKALAPFGKRRIRWEQSEQAQEAFTVARQNRVRPSCWMQAIYVNLMYLSLQNRAFASDVKD